MIAARRAQANFALDRALVHARRAGPAAAGVRAAAGRLPVGVGTLPPVRARRHGGQRAGVRSPGRRATSPTWSPKPGAGRGLLEALAAEAAVVVTDDFPAFFLPRMVERGRRAAAGAAGGGGRQRPAADARRGPCLADRAGDPPPGAAHARRAPRHHARPRPVRPAGARPAARPPRGRRDGDGRMSSRGAIAAAGSTRCQSRRTWRRPRYAAARWPARARLAAFVGDGLAGYLSGDARSGARRRQRPVAVPALRPCLGARGVHRGDATRRLARPAAAARHRGPGGLVGRLAGRRGLPRSSSSRGASSASTCAPHRPDYDAFDSLPAWALDTLRRHAGDRRDHVYTPEVLEAARHPRPAVERRPASAGARGTHPQLSAHAVGQEDPAVVADPARTRWRP